jgi:hypothetical protein
MQSGQRRITANASKGGSFRAGTFYEGQSGLIGLVATTKPANERCTMFIETCIVTVILLGITMSGVGQEKPDFSGEWILDRQASTLSPGADAMRSGVVRIEHREPTFRYKAAFVSEGGPLEYEYELLSDGRESVSTQQGITTASSLRWEGDALVASWRIHRPEGEMKISFRHELLDAGRRLRAAEQLRSSGRDQDNVWIFERR